MVGRGILVKLIISIDLLARAIFHHTVSGGYISEYITSGKFWISVYWEIRMSKRANLKELNSNNHFNKILEGMARYAGQLLVLGKSTYFAVSPQF